MISTVDSNSHGQYLSNDESNSIDNIITHYGRSSFSNNFNNNKFEISIIKNILFLSIINILIPNIIFQLTSNLFNIDYIHCLLLAIIPPILQLLYRLILSNYYNNYALIDIISIISIISILITIILIIEKINPILMLMRDSIVTGIIGIIYFLSIILYKLIPKLNIKPILFYIIRQLISDNGIEINKLNEFIFEWRNSNKFQYSIYLSTLVWSIVLIFELLLKYLFIRYYCEIIIIKYNFNALFILCNIIFYTIIIFTLYWQLYYYQLIINTKNNKIIIHQSIANSNSINAYPIIENSNNNSNYNTNIDNDNDNDIILNGLNNNDYLAMK